MTPKTIAIEEDLTPYSKALAGAGFRVIPLNENALHRAQAIVVLGMDDNFMGIEDPLTKAPVINAAGLTAEEVLQEVKNRLL